jgi:Pyridoxamine 5'-phosphate oxidase
MAGWSEVEEEAPELAARARGYFDLFVHKTIATLRRDGSPRISGIEMEFIDGDIWLGSMWGAVKALDLRRDPRFALHSGSVSPPEWHGDAKIAGRVEEITDPEVILRINGERAPAGPSHLFRADILELSVIELGDPPDHMVIDSWHPGRGVTHRRR